jgi:hypothetical protein
MLCKRPSELRSRRTPKGTIIRLNDDLHQQNSDQTLEEGSSLRKPAEGNVGRFDEWAGSLAQNITSDSSPKAIEVPLLSLVVNKRKGKSKGGPSNAMSRVYSQTAFNSSYGRL